MRRQRLVGLPEDLGLRVEILDDRLDHHRGRDDLLDCRDAAQNFVRIGPTLLRKLLEALAHRGEPALRRSRGSVVERDVAARGGHDLSDPAAHLTRSHDEDVLEIHTQLRL